MRFLYSFLMYLATPFLLLRLWYKGQKEPGYRKHISQRFCLDTMPVDVFDVWIHAVSLGEVIAASPLIDALLLQKKTYSCHKYDGNRSGSGNQSL